MNWDNNNRQRKTIYGTEKNLQYRQEQTLTNRPTKLWPECFSIDECNDLVPHVQRLVWISYWNMAYAQTKMPSNVQKYPDVSKCAHAWIQAHFVCTSQSTWNWAHMLEYLTPHCPRPYLDMQIIFKWALHLRLLSLHDQKIKKKEWLRRKKNNLTKHLRIIYDLYIDGMKIFPVDIQIPHVMGFLRALFASCFWRVQTYLCFLLLLIALFAFKSFYFFLQVLDIILLFFF